MTVENFHQEMNTLLDKRPYTVFTIELHGGKRFEIDFPKAVALKDGVAVYLAPASNASPSKVVCSVWWQAARRLQASRIVI